VAALAFVGAMLWPDTPALIATRHQRPSWTTGDLDTALIHAGLVHAPRLSDTLRWWTGSWVMGPGYPFYRPLTSLLFWCEWRAFGDQEWLYRFPTIFAHAAATFLFAALVYQLALRIYPHGPLAGSIASAWIFTGLASPILNRYGVASAVALQWKNQPDSFAAAFVFAALLAYLVAQQGQRGSLAAAAGLYVAGCGFKEAAVPLPLACTALEMIAPLSGRRAAPFRVLVMASAGALFLTARHMAIHGVGYTYGDNRQWVRRTLLELLGPMGPLALGEWLGVAVAACWVFAYLFYRSLRKHFPTVPPRWHALGVLGGSIVVSAVLGVAALPADMRGGALGWLRPVSLTGGYLLGLQPTTLATAVLVVSVALLCRACAGIAVLGMVWTVAFLAPLTVSSGPVHRYYLPQAGYALMYALAVPAALSAVRRRTNPEAASAVLAACGGSRHGLR
jgi:hypothetical protein